MRPRVISANPSSAPKWSVTRYFTPFSTSDWTRASGGLWKVIKLTFFPCVSLSGEAAKKTKHWLAMETKSTCILRSGKGGTKRHAFSDRPTVTLMKEHAF